MPDAHRRHILNGFWALVLFCGLTALLLRVVNVAAQGPLQHDIILLLDNSGSMVRPYRITGTGTEAVTPYDADQRRIRFSRFLIRLLQNSPADNTAVGAALFAAEVNGVRPMSSTIMLAPLTAVTAWTAADVAAIQQKPCPAPDAVGPDGRRLAQQPGRDFCFGTRYDAAFAWAARQLQGTVPCNNPARRCDVLVFTDGALNEPNSDSMKAVQQSLQRLASQGIEVSVVLFSSLNTEPANVSEWRRWQESGMVRQVTTYASDLPVQQLYEQGLDSLGLTALLNGYTPVELPQETIVLADQLPLNTSNLRLDLITDSPITDTYSLPPTLVTDRLRWWSAPPFATLTGTLQGSGLAYYRVVSETIPVAASVTLLPEIQQVSKTVGIQVLVGAGFHALDDSSAHVTGLVEPGEITTPLRYDGVVWRGELPLLNTGDYTVTALIEPLTRTIVGKPQVQTPVLKIVSRPQPKAILRVIPATLFAGRSFEIDASLSLENIPMDLLSGSPMTVTINPGNHPVQLNPAGKGYWRGSDLIEKPDEYRITGQIEEAGVMAAVDPVSLTVLAYPQIQVTTPVTEAVAGATITATITISPPYSLTPKVWVREGLQRKRVEPNLVQPIAVGVFRVVVVMPARRDLQIGVEVTGQDVKGARLETITSEAFLVGQKTTFAYISWWWIIPAILVVGLVVALILHLVRVKQEDAIVSDLQDDPKNREKWKKIEGLNVNRNWRVIKALAANIETGILIKIVEKDS